MSEINNRIVVNPESKRSAENLLIHELDHAVRGYFGKDGSRMTTVFKEAIEGVDQATRDKIVREYKKVALPGELASTVMDETNAYYAEKVLTNKNTLERIVEAEPGLKDKILSFFKGAAADYADVPKLSGAAKKYYRTYKKMFDEFSARNAQSNASENAHLSTLFAENAQKIPLTNMKQEDMSVSDRQYAVGDNQQASIYDYKKSFAEQVDDYKNGKIPKGDSLLIGGTPKVLRDIGLNALPMTINQTHVDYAVNGTKNIDHSIGDALLKQLPTALENPVAIIASRTSNSTSLVAILSVTHNGNQVNVPVYIDGYGFQNGVMIDSNAITSVYARKNAITTLLKDAIQNEAAGKIGVYYWDKKRATTLLSNGKVTMPNILNTLSDGSIHSILENDSPVKPKLKNITESQQFKRWFGDWQKHPDKASKVVNSDGTPMVVYHGTNSEFWTFEKGHKRTRGRLNLGEGFYFGAKKSRAEVYVESSSGKVMEVYVDIKKPYEVIGNSFTEFEMDDIRSKLPAEDRTRLNYDNVNEYLAKLGYDGIIGYNYSGTQKTIDQVVVFKSEQIKSATDNIGTFSPHEKDIRYALDIDSEGENISGAEVMSWLNDRPKGDGKLDLKATVARGLPYKRGRSSLTVGEIRKVIANTTHEKVYSKGEAMKVVKKLSGTWGLTQRARDEIADTVWQFLNEAPDVEYRRDMA